MDEQGITRDFTVSCDPWWPCDDTQADQYDCHRWPTMTSFVRHHVAQLGQKVIMIHKLETKESVYRPPNSNIYDGLRRFQEIIWTMQRHNAWLAPTGSYIKNRHHWHQFIWKWKRSCSLDLTPAVRRQHRLHNNLNYFLYNYFVLSVFFHL